MTERQHPRPKLVLSKCLELEACRYNAQIIRAPFVLQLEPYVEIQPVCPEVEVGLGTPRDPIRLVSIEGRTRLVQPTTERDLTEEMEGFSQTFLERLTGVDGFILKSRSPSCGIKDTKVYAGEGGRQPSGKGPGMFGGAVLARFPYAAIEDEGRLTNFRLRHHFLVKLFMRAAFRAVVETKSLAALVEFQTANKFQLMACNQTAMRALGRVVANGARRPFDEITAEYEEGLARALARPARDRSVVNVLMHALGYVSDGLTASEKKHFLELLEQYRAKQITLGTPLAILQSWIHRFGQDYLERQTFLEPYPLDLMDLRDSGRN